MMVNIMVLQILIQRDQTAMRGAVIIRAKQRSNFRSFYKMALDTSQGIPVNHNISINEDQNISLCVSYTSITSPGRSNGIPAVGRHKKSKLGCQFSGFICGSIVNDNEFIRRARRIQEHLQAPAQIIPTIMNWDHNR